MSPLGAGGSTCCRLCGGTRGRFHEAREMMFGTRERFRRINFLRDVAVASIVGQGKHGYLVALEAIVAWAGTAARG